LTCAAQYGFYEVNDGCHHADDVKRLKHHKLPALFLVLALPLLLVIGLSSALARGRALASSPLSEVNIDGPGAGMVNSLYTFTAAVAPLTATSPITYVWQTTDQLPITHTAGLTDAIAFSWGAPGLKTITVTAANALGPVTATHHLTLAWHSAFLPLITDIPSLIPPDDLAMEQTIADLINQQRADHGLYPLILVPELTESARRHSNDMADNGFTGHTGSDGSNAGQRMAEAGYDWIAWGEIIAWGFGGDPASVVDWWMNSSPHRSLILSSYFLDFGVGYARAPASQYGHYWTVNFGRRADAVTQFRVADEQLTCAFMLAGPAGGGSVMTSYIPETEVIPNQLQPSSSLGAATICQ